MQYVAHSDGAITQATKATSHASQVARRVAPDVPELCLVKEGTWHKAGYSAFASCGSVCAGCAGHFYRTSRV